MILCTSSRKRSYF